MIAVTMRLFLVFSLTVTLALGVCAGYVFFVPPLERDLAAARKEASEFQRGLIQSTADFLARSSKISDTSMQEREQAHEQVRRESSSSQVAVTVAKPLPGGMDLDAVLPAAVSEPVVRMYCAAAKANDCSGGRCRESAATGLCAQADVGTQITLTTRQLAAALIRCSQWTGEAGADRLAIERYTAGMGEDAE